MLFVDYIGFYSCFFLMDLSVIVIHVYGYSSIVGFQWVIVPTDSQVTLKYGVIRPSGAGKFFPAKKAMFFIFSYLGLVD